MIDAKNYQDKLPNANKSINDTTSLIGAVFTPQSQVAATFEQPHDRNRDNQVSSSMSESTPSLRRKSLSVRFEI